MLNSHRPPPRLFAHHVRSRRMTAEARGDALAAELAALRRQVAGGGGALAPSPSLASPTSSTAPHCSPATAAVAAYQPAATAPSYGGRPASEARGENSQSVIHMLKVALDDGRQKVWMSQLPSVRGCCRIGCKKRVQLAFLLVHARLES